MRFIENRFEPESQTTLGGVYTSKKIFYNEKNTIIDYCLIDTAGQEKYHAVIKYFYRDSHVIGLVYSIDNIQSFEAVKNYWYPEVLKTSSQEVIVVIIANKDDLYEQAEVTDKQGKEFAKSINAMFIKTSPLSNTGIDQLFKYIGELFLPENVKGIEQSSNVTLTSSPANIKQKKSCC